MGALRLTDGRRASSAQGQERSGMRFLIGAGGAAYFAAFGGGGWSLDRHRVKKAF